MRAEPAGHCYFVYRATESTVPGRPPPGTRLPNPRVGMLQKSTADCERAPHIAEIKKEFNKRCTMTMSLLEASDCESFLAFPDPTQFARLSRKVGWPILLVSIS